MSNTSIDAVSMTLLGERFGRPARARGVDSISTVLGCKGSPFTSSGGKDKMEESSSD